MSPFSIRSPYSSSGTSVSGSMRYRNQDQLTHLPIIVTVTVFPALSGTVANEPVSDQNLLSVLERTTSGLPLSVESPNSVEANRASINELRKLSGLTWEQLAKLFNVSRRSLHLWASGQPLKPFNEETLNRLLGTVKYINRGNASVNRNLLLSPAQDGRLLFDLLIVGEHEQVKQTLGPGSTPQKPQRSPLSKDSSTSRMPPPPENLVAALQDPIHREVGRSRPARVARSRKQGS